MANERLRSAMLTRGISVEQLADHIGVDPKTVERWITKGRAPYRRHRLAVAAYVREDEAYLWPDGLPDGQRKDAADAEVLKVYPHRSYVPPDLWLELFGRAEREIGVLVHAGVFLAENPRWLQLLRLKTQSGVQARILLGDPDSPEIARRGEEEEIGAGVAYKVREVMKLYRPLYDVSGIEFRQHRSTLHNSLYRSDDEWLVNTQVYGVSAPMAPVLHLRKIAGAALVSTYQQSFEKVWAESVPLPR
ncbi:helix-turn-helix domain-containing protein [Streptacidiphilus sp. ASG 303]|uniref:helix-turn-helix domain-containing protein n=1 Tax=Streptacidiphilus sp. ASG 303 TaxID=2896847 RepID=UPI001E29CCD9|nr:helix-turn-helix transcriptional regulator [Streptacidiphilus sp. ASG 303]MCD0483440.1 helix-turn-helix domain-containing protein [Streptacidiphilus sp. ASG 303]